MKLSFVYLNADDEFRKIDYLFYKRCYYGLWFISYYLSSGISKLKVETDHYNRLSIELHPSKEGCEEMFSTNVLVAYVRFREDELKHFNSLTEMSQRYEFFLSLYERGFRMAISCGYTEIPIVALHEAQQRFREDGYKNEWIWKKKLLREDDMYLFFKVHFTFSYISMELIVMDKKKTRVRCQKEILRTITFYDSFWGYFRKLEIGEDDIIINDFINKPFLTIDRKELRKNNIIVTYHDDFFIKGQKSNKELIDEMTW